MEKVAAGRKAEEGGPVPRPGTYRARAKPGYGLGPARASRGPPKAIPGTTPMRKHCLQVKTAGDTRMKEQCPLSTDDHVVIQSLKRPFGHHHMILNEHQSG